MTMLRRREFIDDQNGTTMVEFTLVMLIVIAMTFSVADFGYAYWQWNSAEKATQIAARLAVVSDPVAVELPDFDCGTTNTVPGDPCSSPDAASFGTVTCTGASLNCSGGYTFSATAFNTLLARIQQIFPSVAADNLVIEYRDIGLGFVGREAPVPLVTIRLVGMTFRFFAIDFLTGGPWPMPEFRTTLPGEDIRTTGA
jgi:hypothetical protein